jgi:hypothetical protein
VRTTTKTAVLLVAKAPVPGLVKTRLGAVLGDNVAASLAAAALMDTLELCEAVYPHRDARHVALAGDLCAAAMGVDIAERLGGWTVHPQRGDGFADRLASAHTDVLAVAGVPVVQLGMDTPHLLPAELAEVAARVGTGNDAVLGRAEDGGWWVLAVTQPQFAEALRGVEMSTATTYFDTLSALRAAGARVADATVLRDVDTVQDADAAARTAPHTRFARRWIGLSAGDAQLTAGVFVKSGRGVTDP